MFDIEHIYENLGQYICCCQCDSLQDAEFICAKYSTLPKKFDIVGEIFPKGSTAIIGASHPTATVNIASYINANYFMPPLDIYVFYGSSQKGLESRWCVGFDYPQEQVSNIINSLNNGQKPVFADKDPESWKDKNGYSYSVVMLTGVMEPEPTEDTLELFDQRVFICFNTITNTTLRKLTVNTI